MKTKILLFTFCVLLYSQISLAAIVEVIDGTHKGEKYVSIEGQIEKGDYNKVIKNTISALSASQNRLTFSLNSSGGNVLEAIRIGRFIREVMGYVELMGNEIYLHGSKVWYEEIELRKSMNETNYGLKAVKEGEPITDVLRKCYSSCLLIFFGGVSKFILPNQDCRYQENWLDKQAIKLIPIAGVHSISFKTDEYGSLPPDEAKIKYNAIEKHIRFYMNEMGVSELLIERMLKTSSNNIDLLSSKELSNYYNQIEPFFNEWLLAKCGDGKLNSTEDENRDFEYVYSSREKAIDEGKIKSLEESENFLPPGISRERWEYITNRIKSNYENHTKCYYGSIRKYQDEFDFTKYLGEASE